jgi:hypothetical protein
MHRSFAVREEHLKQTVPREGHFQCVLEFFMLKVTDYPTQVDENQNMSRYV